jgi:hypothetical protein
VRLSVPRRLLLPLVAAVLVAFGLTPTLAVARDLPLPPVPTPESECMRFATDGQGFPAVDMLGDHINGATSLTFHAVLGIPIFVHGGVGPTCDAYGSRTVQVWEIMANDRGQRRRNSPILDLIKDSNEAMPWTWFTLRLFKPYTCLPSSVRDRRRRRAGRYWGFVERVIATYGGKTEKPQEVYDGVQWFGRYC